jgi:serine/threonine protein kinase
MSPEQTLDPNSVDIRADIYSLGVTLFEMLAGAKPYTGSETVDIVKKVMEEPVPDPRKRNPQISKACSALVMRMMAKNKEDRHPNAEALNRDIKALLSGKTGILSAETKMAENNGDSPGKGGAFREKLAALCRNHWFLAGVTAGVTFFLLAAAAAAVITYAVEPDIFNDVMEALEKLFEKVADKFENLTD